MAKTFGLALFVCNLLYVLWKQKTQKLKACEGREFHGKEREGQGQSRAQHQQRAGLQLPPQCQLARVIPQQECKAERGTSLPGKCQGWWEKDEVSRDQKGTPQRLL